MKNLVKKEFFFDKALFRKDVIIKRAIEERLEIDDFAAKVGVNPGVIIDVENEKSIDVYSLVKIANYLGADINKDYIKHESYRK